MRYIAEIVAKTLEKDAKGNVLSNTYSSVKKIRINEIIPYSSANASKEFGFQGKTTHKTSSFDEVTVNQFLQFKGKTYRIVEVADYPRVRVLVLEMV